MFREIMAIRTSQMMTSRSLICLLENQNGGKLQKTFSGRVIHKNFHADKFKSFLKSKKLLLINSTKVTSMSNFVDI
jgi:hypothetical protein